MSLSVAELMAAERVSGFARLSGSRLRVSVPVREALIARMWELVPLPSAIRDPDVRFYSGNQMRVAAGVRVLGFTKRIEATVRIAAAMEPGPPRRILVTFAGRSLLSTAVGLLAPFVGGLPEAVRIENDTITLDLDRLAAEAGFGDLVGCLRRMTFDGRDGVMWIEIEAEVDAARPGKGPPATSPQRRHPATRVHGGTTWSTAELLDYFQGLHTELHLRVEESLVNDALEAIGAGLRRTEASAAPRPNRPPQDAAGLLGALGTPRVRFEPGAAWIDLELRL